MDGLAQVEQQATYAAQLTCAVALIWLAMLAGVALRHRRSPEHALAALRRLGAPTLLCRALLLVVCVGVGQPAYADQAPAHRGSDSGAPATPGHSALARSLDGLPSSMLPAPDPAVRRAVTVTVTKEPARPPRDRTRDRDRDRSCGHVVRSGDSLWSIAEGLLASRSRRDAPPVASIDRAWRAVYARNRPAVGPDPDVLGIGMHLDASSLDPRCNL